MKKKKSENRISENTKAPKTSPLILSTSAIKTSGSRIFKGGKRKSCLNAQRVAMQGKGSSDILKPHLLPVSVPMKTGSLF